MDSSQKLKKKKVILQLQNKKKKLNSRWEFLQLPGEKETKCWENTDSTASAFMLQFMTIEEQFLEVVASYLKYRMNK